MLNLAPLISQHYCCTSFLDFLCTCRCCHKCWSQRRSPAGRSTPQHGPVWLTAAKGRARPFGTNKTLYTIRYDRSRPTERAQTYNTRLLWRTGRGPGTWGMVFGEWEKPQIRVKMERMSHEGVFPADEQKVTSCSTLWSGGRFSGKSRTWFTVLNEALTRWSLLHRVEKLKLYFMQRCPRLADS